MSPVLDALRARCDAHLERALDGAGPPRLNAAMRHAVLGGGKRIRPLLVYAAGAACGVPRHLLDPAAVAIELVHAYSLVHDDLPAMDDDDLRRGQPTVHRAFDEATAILAGDALQALAFEQLMQGAALGLPADAVLAQARELARAAGAGGMVGGQAIDLAGVGAGYGRAELEDMHALKTGALIVAAHRLGSLAAAPGHDAARTALDRHAVAIGLAFQIQDDLLDAVGDPALTGKAVGADARRGKPTFVTVLGVDAARDRVDSLWQAAAQARAGIDGDASLLDDLVAVLHQRAG